MKKLREYKGIVYKDGAWHFNKTDGIARSAVNACQFFIINATDDDYAALMDLKASPWEPTPESVVEAWFTDANKDWEFSKALLCTRLRSAFPQIDAPLTAADHIAALVAMGAKLQPQSLLFIGKPDVLILPPEMTP